MYFNSINNQTPIEAELKILLPCFAFHLCEVVHMLEKMYKA